MLPIMEINEKHTSFMDIRVPPMIHDFVDAFLKQTSYMQNVIDSCSNTRIVFETDEQKLETMKAHFVGISERHVKRINELVESLSPSRWDMFNATTYFTSHYPVSPIVRAEIDGFAERFLDMRYPFAPVIIQLNVQQEFVNRPDFGTE